MAFERRTEPVVHEERVVERRSIMGRLIGAIFATAVGILAFVGLLVVIAVVLLIILL